jgi:hypothetical protein
MPSPHPQLAYFQLVDALSRIESQDSECTVSEAIGEMGAPAEEAVVESPNLDVVMTVVANPVLEGAEGSSAQDTTLVLASPRWPTSPPAALVASSQRLDDDVVQHFDAIHHLSELTVT